MELSRFDLIVIRDALMSVIQAEGNVNVSRKSAYQSTRAAVIDILTEYPDASVFEVTPNKLEE